MCWSIFANILRRLINCVKTVNCNVMSMCWWWWWWWKTTTTTTTTTTTLTTVIRCLWCCRHHAAIFRFHADRLMNVEDRQAMADRHTKPTECLEFFDISCRHNVMRLLQQKGVVTWLWAWEAAQLYSMMPKPQWLGARCCCKHTRHCSVQVCSSTDTGEWRYLRYNIKTTSIYCAS